MAYEQIATINVSLQSVGVTAQGFGTPLFASSHRYFPERVRVYTSLADAATDFPTDSPAYKAVAGYLSNTPSVSSVKIGRREADLDLTVAVGSTTGSLTVFASDGVDTYSVVVDVTAQLDEDAVATAIAAAIEADTDIAPLVAATAIANEVNLDAQAVGATFWVKTLSDNLTETYNTTETAADLLAAITLEDDDFYFFSADDHTETFVLAAAADIEARTKMYFFSTAQQTALTAYTEGSATDILGKIADFGYFRTNGMFHDLADSIFPETNFVGYNAPFDAGRATWNYLTVPVINSKDPSSGIKLSTTQKGYLGDRSASYIENYGGVNIIRGGNVASGEYIDVIRGRDNLTVDLETENTNFIISRQGSKVPYNDEGIAQLHQICRNVLSRYVTRGFINSNFKTTFLREDQVSTADKNARLYQGGTFEAELTGAIEVVKITGYLSTNL